MKRLLGRLYRESVAVFKNESGGVLSEYGLLMALIAIACILAMIFLGGVLNEKFRYTGNQIKSAQPLN